MPLLAQMVYVFFLKVLNRKKHYHLFFRCQKYNVPYNNLC